jgi:predicted metal-dependent phosphoesterase TrpH
MPHRHLRIAPEDLSPVAERRPPGGAVFEMHAHSSDRSLDSGVRATAIAEQAKWRGLDGVCLTEHNALWEPAAVAELSERAEVCVLAGMELGTDAGHVLVYGLDRYRPELLMLERLRRIVEEEGAAMVLAHPMRPYHGKRPGWDEFDCWFEGIEAINGDHSDSEHSYLVRQAASHGLSAIGGSDAHSRDAVGRVGTAFPGPVPDVEALVAFIREKRTGALDFRPR